VVGPGAEAMRPRAVLTGAILAVLALGAASGCGRDSSGNLGHDSSDSGPAVRVSGDEEGAAQDLGFPIFATKNTTRIGGADPVANAAGVALAVFPSQTRGTRPAAVALVDGRDWRVGLAAAVLGSSPVRAPILFSDGRDLPGATRDALAALDPTGARSAGGAEVIRVGDVARPTGLRTADLAAKDPFALARAVDAYHAATRGSPSRRVLVVSADAPAYAVPAGAWAAKAGDPVLFVRRDTVPEQTRAALRAHKKPDIYVLGPPSVVSSRVVESLRSLGDVVRISGPDPIRNAIAATPLSAHGSYGPLLLVVGGDRLGPAVEAYLLDIRPGYRSDPVRGVYNHGWIVGDDRALGPTAQARLDELLEIEPVSAPSQGQVP
jgi:hypothetical protein